MLKKVKTLNYLIGCLFLLSACGPKSRFESYQTIKEAAWYKNDILAFEPALTNLKKPVDLQLNIRHSGLYPYSNLYLFINTTLPNGTNRTDTVNCILADNRGKWLGSGIGDIFEYKQPIGRIIAPENGKYKFTIQQGMRKDTLEEIMDIGLTIKDTNE